MFNNKELEHALCFYEGDVREEEKKDAFWGDENAYSTINALLFDGIENERMKVLERRPLNPAFLERAEETIALCGRLLKACQICSKKNPEMETYRVERLSNYRDCVRAGRTIAFTSTSANGFLREYQDKMGLALMRFRIPERTPCVIFSDVMPNYKKAQEAEILLPPFLKLSFEETELTKEEAQILDANKEAPKVSCVVRVENTGYRAPDENTAYLQDGGIYWQKGIDAGKRVFHALKCQREPKKEDIFLYSQWKKELKQRIWREFVGTFG